MSAGEKESCVMRRWGVFVGRVCFLLGFVVLAWIGWNCNVVGGVDNFVWSVVFFFVRC